MSNFSYNYISSNPKSFHQGRIIVPFEKINLDDEGCHLIINGFLNGNPIRMVVDTGASRTVFDMDRLLKIAPETNIEKNELDSAGLGTSTMESFVAFINHLQFGDYILNNYVTAALDLKHVNESYEKIGLKAVDGVLGGDIFSLSNALIDYKNLIITFN